MGVYFANKKLKNKKILHHIALIASWVYNKREFSPFGVEKKELVYNKTCKVSDYQLGPALKKKNPYIYMCMSTILAKPDEVDG